MIDPTVDELRASLERGLADAAEGNVRRLDWVTTPEGVGPCPEES